MFLQPAVWLKINMLAFSLLYLSSMAACLASIHFITFPSHLFLQEGQAMSMVCDCYLHAVQLHKKRKKIMERANMCSSSSLVSAAMLATGAAVEALSLLASFLAFQG